MPKKDSLELDLDCLTARGRAFELNSQLSGGYGGCLQVAIDAGARHWRFIMYCNYSKVLSCTWAGGCA